MEIIIDPVNQFIFSLNQLFCKTSKEKLTEDLIEYYKDIEGNMSPLLFSDLKYFFKDSGLGYILYHNGTVYESVESYLNSLSNLAKFSREEVIEKLLANKSYLKELYENVDLNEFIKEIFLSYFPFSMLTLSVDTCKKVISMVFNYKYTETLDPVKMFEKSIDFLKTISDVTRIKIIRLLAL